VECLWRILEPEKNARPRAVTAERIKLHAAVQQTDETKGQMTREAFPEIHEGYHCARKWFSSTECEIGQMIGVTGRFGGVRKPMGVQFYCDKT
jgi:hypothetical protein